MINLNNCYPEPGGILDYNQVFFASLEKAMAAEKFQSRDSWAYADLGSSNPATFFVGCHAARQMKLIATLHDAPLACSFPFRKMLSGERLLSGILNRTLGSRLNSSILSHAYCLIALSEQGLSAIRRTGSPAKTLLLRHFAFSQQEKTLTNVLTRALYFIGFVRPQKGFQEYLHVFQKLRTKYPDLEARVVGTIKDQKYFAECLSRENLRKEELTLLAPSDDNSFAGALIPPGVALFTHKAKKTVSASGALMRALGSGLPSLVPIGSTLAEYCTDGLGLHFTDLHDCVHKAEKLFDHFDTTRRAEALAKTQQLYGLENITTTLVRFLKSLEN